jgi:hypothetical protein
LLIKRNFTRTLALCLALFYITITPEFYDFNILNRLPDVNISALVVTCSLVVFLFVFIIRARHRH